MNNLGKKLAFNWLLNSYVMRGTCQLGNGLSKALFKIQLFLNFNFLDTSFSISITSF